MGDRTFAAGSATPDQSRAVQEARRHSAVSLLSAAGVPLEEVADLLGHVSTRVISST
jgi:hypothetical protein